MQARLAFGLTLSVALLAVRTAVSWTHIVPWFDLMVSGVLVAEVVRLMLAAIARRGVPWSGLIARGCAPPIPPRPAVNVMVPASEPLKRLRAIAAKVS